eukprot:1161514-Pelagomonas_calceolata.AAC.2
MDIILLSRDRLIHTRTHTHTHTHTHTQAQRQAAELSSLPDHQRELYRSERLGIWTKLRPGVREFLAKAAEKFELWVYSSGSRCVWGGGVSLHVFACINALQACMPGRSNTHVSALGVLLRQQMCWEGLT